MCFFSLTLVSLISWKKVSCNWFLYTSFLLVIVVYSNGVCIKRKQFSFVFENRLSSSFRWYSSLSLAPSLFIPVKMGWYEEERKMHYMKIINEYIQYISLFVLVGGGYIWVQRISMSMYFCTEKKMSENRWCQEIRDQSEQFSALGFFKNNSPSVIYCFWPNCLLFLLSSFSHVYFLYSIDQLLVYLHGRRGQTNCLILINLFTQKMSLRVKTKKKKKIS